MRPHRDPGAGEPQVRRDARTAADAVTDLRAEVARRLKREPSSRTSLVPAGEPHVYRRRVERA